MPEIGKKMMEPYGVGPQSPRRPHFVSLGFAYRVDMRDAGELVDMVGVGVQVHKS